MLWIKIVEIVFFYIRMIPHETVSFVDKPLYLGKADIGFLKRKRLWAAGNCVVPFGKVVIVPSDAEAKAVVRDEHPALSDAIGVDTEVSGGHRHLTPVAGLGDEAHADQFPAVEPTQIVRVEEHVAEQRRGNTADLHWQRKLLFLQAQR